MTKYIKGKDGKFKGSIGSGKNTPPTSAPIRPGAVIDTADLLAAFDKSNGAPVRLSDVARNPETTDVDKQLRDGIDRHLSSRIYPPAPAMTDSAVEAVKNVASGDGEKFVDLPKGVSWRGGTSAPSSEIVSGHRLDDHVETYRELAFPDAVFHGECDVCGNSYEVSDREDHCAECGTCWEHCLHQEPHYDDVA